MEIQLIRNDGSWLPGAEMTEFIREMAEETAPILEERVNEDSTPDIIKKKVKSIKAVRKDKGHLHDVDYVVVGYDVPGSSKPVEIDAIGKDTHVTAVGTWIIELVSPPCEYLEELQWWLHNLLSVVYDYAHKELTGSTIISAGLNPTQQFETGLSFGDHHHIGVPDKTLRLYVYNMLRTFIPHLVAISVNSPLSNNEIPAIDELGKEDPKRLRSSSSLSQRLENNTGQLGVTPFLKSDDIDYFSEVVKKPVDMCRMVDIFPFTSWGTIEVRLFDAQPSVLSRLAIAVVIQALALKAKKFYESKTPIPEIDMSCLERNRKFALQSGPLSAYKGDANFDSDSSEFIQVYQGGCAPDFSSRLGYMFQAVENMIYFLRDEFAEMGLIGTPYLEPLGLCVFPGSKDNRAPPIPPAVYQLHVLHKNDLDITKLVRQLEMDMENTCQSSDGLFNPLSIEFGSPTWPTWINPISLTLDLTTQPTVVFGGDEVSCTLTVTNDGGVTADNVVSHVVVTDNYGTEVFVDDLAIPTIDPGSSGTAEFKFTTDEMSTTYKISYDISVNGKSIISSYGSLSIARITADINYLGADAIHLGPDQEIPLSFEIRSLIPEERELIARVRMIDRTTRGKTFSEVKEHKVTLPPNGKILFASDDLTLARSVQKSLFAGQSYEIVQPFTYHVKSSRAQFPSFYFTLDIIDSATGRTLAKSFTKAFTIIVKPKRKKYKVQLLTRHPILVSDVTRDFKIEFEPSSSSLPESKVSMSVLIQFEGKSMTIGNLDATLSNTTISLNVPVCFHGKIGRPRTTTECILLLKFQDGEQVKYSLGTIELIASPTVEVSLDSSSYDIAFLESVTPSAQLILRNIPRAHVDLVATIGSITNTLSSIDLKQDNPTSVDLDLSQFGMLSPGTHRLELSVVQSGKSLGKTSATIHVIKTTLFAIGMKTTPLLASIIRVPDGTMTFTPKIRYVGSSETTVIVQFRIVATREKEVLIDQQYELSMGPKSMEVIPDIVVQFYPSKTPRFYRWEFKLSVKKDSTIVPLPEELISGKVKHSFGVLA